MINLLRWHVQLYSYQGVPVGFSPSESNAFNKEQTFRFSKDVVNWSYCNIRPCHLRDGMVLKLSVYCLNDDLSTNSMIYELFAVLYESHTDRHDMNSWYKTSDDSFHVFILLLDSIFCILYGSGCESRMWILTFIGSLNNFKYWNQRYNQSVQDKKNYM